jgi:hypothetical protein
VGDPKMSDQTRIFTPEVPRDWDKWPKPDHPLSSAEIVAAIEAYPEYIESCNECANDRASDDTMHQYIYAYPISALISNDGHCVRGAGHEPADYGQYRKHAGYFASRKIRKAIAMWRKKVSVPGIPGHFRYRF